MPKNPVPIDADLHELFATPFSTDRLEAIRTGERLRRVMSSYVIGHIFWRKSLGRPQTATLAEAISVKAWGFQWLEVTKPGGGKEWKAVKLDYPVSLHDAPDDADHWRVAYAISGVPSGRTHDPHYSLKTHVVPSLRRVSWPRTGGRFAIPGPRVFQPPAAEFVKEDGLVERSFEIVIDTTLVFPPIIGT